MRFIRKGGRVIPISEPGDKQLAKRKSAGGYGKTAALGAAAGVALGGAPLMAQAMKLGRVAKVLKPLSFGIATAAIGRMVYKGKKVENEVAAKTKDKNAADWAGTKENVKHLGAYEAGAFGAAAASVLAFKPTFKAAVSAAMKVKPMTGKFADWKKFRKATKVASTVVHPLRKLLK